MSNGDTLIHKVTLTADGETWGFALDPYDRPSGTRSDVFLTAGVGSLLNLAERKGESKDRTYSEGRVNNPYSKLGGKDVTLEFTIKNMDDGPNNMGPTYNTLAEFHTFLKKLNFTLNTDRAVYGPYSAGYTGSDFSVDDDAYIVLEVTFSIEESR